MLLQLNDVEVRYGPIRALRNVSLAVDQGEIVALLGANGAGKSTTLRTISGLVRPSSGAVVFDGRPIQRAASHDIVGLGIGHVPEGRRIFPLMTVLENLEMGAYLHRGNFSENLERVFSLFPVLAERRRQDGGTLSGGEQQMLAIGRALLTSPTLLIMDEPSEGLAPMMVNMVGKIIRQLKEQGLSILLVEQNLPLALKLSDYLYIMGKGVIICESVNENSKENEEMVARHICI